MVKADLEIYQEGKEEMKKLIERSQHYSLRIKELREAQQMSQEEFARRCGHTSDNARSWASKVENGRIKLSLDDAEIVAKALNVSPAALIFSDAVNVRSPYDLSNDELRLINLYRKLSKNGRSKVIERINELLTLEEVAR